MNLQFAKELSYVAFIANAIQDYYGRHYGRYPAKIKLHPEVFASFKMELKNVARYSLNTMNDLSLDGCHYLRFHGVTIQEYAKAVYPEMIGHDGVVEYF